MGRVDLLKKALDQKEHRCVLNPEGQCEFYFKYKGFGFCASELLGEGCRVNKDGKEEGKEIQISVIHKERKKGSEKIPGAEKPH